MSWKAQARRMINRVLEPAGFTLRHFQPEMRFREMISPQVRMRQIEAFLAAMTESLANFPELASQLPSAAQIRTFTEALPRCPVAQDTGGGGFSAAMLLWTIARAIEPALVVESGTFRGFTTWVLRQAVPQARQYAFDISFAERQQLEEGVSYHEHDWMDLPLNCPAQTTALIYFDDHVDQWQRIREAAPRVPLVRRNCASWASACAPRRAAGEASAIGRASDRSRQGVACCRIQTKLKPARASAARSRPGRRDFSGIASGDAL
ncbi:MAG TPA: hypothetical protein VNK45_07035 [Candidatus Acidoferrales bacterium]|nr:hypothetical protein [Candidatus Acidoferrales bacterium]